MIFRGGGWWYIITSNPTKIVVKLGYVVVVVGVVTISNDWDAANGLNRI